MPGADMGIDMGTSNTLIYLAGKGVMLNEPSVMAVHAYSEEIIAIGQEAHRMLGRTSDSIKVFCPMNNGVISDYRYTQYMMREYIRRVSNNAVFNPRVVLCVPGVITEVERRAAVDALHAAGARRICLLDETIAAAMGAGMNVTGATGCGIIDIGGGTADMAVISLGGIASSRSCKKAGRVMDEAVMNMVRSKHNLWIGERMAEEAKKAIGCARMPETNREFTVRGRDARTGLPASRVITSEQVYEALQPTIRQIGEELTALLENTPPELVGDLYEHGMMLTGGGAMLDGIDEVLSQYSRLQVRRADNPAECVVMGAGAALKYLDETDETGRGFVSPLIEV